MDKKYKPISSKLQKKHVNGEPYIFIIIDRFIKRLVVQICKLTEAKEVIKFLEKFRQPLWSTLKLPSGTKAVERAIKTLKNLIIADLDDKIDFTEKINCVLRVMRITIPTGFKVSPFEVHHGRKPRTEQNNKVKNKKSYLSDCKTKNTCQYHRKSPNLRSAK